MVGRRLLAGVLAVLLVGCASIQSAWEWSDTPPPRATLENSMPMALSVGVALAFFGCPVCGAVFAATGGLIALSLQRNSLARWELMYARYLKRTYTSKPWPRPSRADMLEMGRVAWAYAPELGLAYKRLQIQLDCWCLQTGSLDCPR